MGRSSSGYVLFAEPSGYWVGEESNWPDRESDKTPDLSASDMIDENPLLEGLLPGTRDKEPQYDDAILEALNRTHLWAILREISKEYRNVTSSATHGQSLQINLPCGNSISYLAFDDIPIESTLCTCGLEWVIKYTAPWTKNLPR